MSTMTKSLLVASVISLGAGIAFNADLIDVRDVSPCYLALPTGAICLGLFLISWMLEKETARYDQEHSHATSKGPTASGHGSSQPANPC